MPGGGPGIVADEPPLRDVHFQRGLLRDPGHASTVSMIG